MKFDELFQVLSGLPGTEEDTDRDEPFGSVFSLFSFVLMLLPYTFVAQERDGTPFVCKAFYHTTSLLKLE